MVVLRYYKNPGLTTTGHEVTLKKIQEVSPDLVISKLTTELCYNVQTPDTGLSEEDERKLKWILSTPFQKDTLSSSSSIQTDSHTLFIEIGPRLNFSTALSTNAVSICKVIGLNHISRIETSVRYSICFHDNMIPPADIEDRLVQCLHDRMTQCRYSSPIKTFELQHQSNPVFEVNIMGEGRSALEKANTELGLAFDEWDLDYYTELFKEKVGRNPTSVECFDLAQSNSEHSRHWFFRGRLMVDGVEQPDSLFKMIMSTQDFSNNNNIIKFSDNSSGIKGYDVMVLKPSSPAQPSKMTEVKPETRHIIFTAETHNFPTGVAPFPGATTGTGGRIRDVQSAGRGAHVVAGTVGYSFGNLNIPGYIQPWEEETAEYPANFAPPLEIAIEASNGASDYGNKFGEPVIAGFARSFGLSIGEGPDRQRREYIKPIMFSGGIGQLLDAHIEKKVPEKGMEVAKVGGPVYRIGVGGGAASSVQVQGDNKVELDFGAVQRGDAEMEQKLNRVIRACVEMGTENPIASIHDQGAGGNGNVLKEIVEPAGAVIRAADFQLGDPTISILELWGAEYQETNAILLSRQHMPILEKIGKRERCPVNFVGTVSGDGKVKLENFPTKKIKHRTPENVQQVGNGDKNGLEKDGHGDCLSSSGTVGLTNSHSTDQTDKSMDSMMYPVDLDLEHVLGKMPRKVFELSRVPYVLPPLSLPDDIQVTEALHRVLRLPAVASKRYLTNKVDRCVTGLVAQQQCVGPLHTPLADVAVTALTHMEKVGSATAIGEQPVKGLIDPGCGARMSVGEALTNLVFARVSDLKDVKCSGNWMWPAKLPGEGAMLIDACSAMCDVMKKLDIAVDGGKDSLSMAARLGNSTVKSPGTLVISVYVGCPDITATVTPDLKCPQGEGALIHVDIGCGKRRLGGTALAQCYRQVGNESPDLDHPDVLSNAFKVTQELIKDKKITAGHDISDGGLVSCLLEMAFAGNCGLDVNIEPVEKGQSEIASLFHEELGLILELHKTEAQSVIDAYTAANVPCSLIGSSTNKSSESEISIQVAGKEVIKNKMADLRDIWEETSFQLECLQANPHCVQQERDGLKYRVEPPYHVPFEPDVIHIVPKGKPKPLVAVVREEGSNSDREMAAVLHMVGFEVWDVNMEDLCQGEITLERFQGIVFVGGFSYADVLGSAKGWAATAKFNPSIQEQLLKFKARKDTFSLGVCNGCQLMGLLGWVAMDRDSSDGSQQGVLLDHNDSGRFECRFVTVKVDKSPAIMFREMEGTVFGMWSAHGEGKMVFKSPEVLSRIQDNNLIPVRYVDDDGSPTTVYPFNPNGSPDGIAALCSPDGRHLAIMPHPERCYLPWQCPWLPWQWKDLWDASPWLKMFQNAYDWSIQQ